MDRKSLTFEQAEGLEPLPSQLDLKQLSQPLRAQLWSVVFDHSKAGLAIARGAPPNSFGSRWTAILKDKHVYRDHRMADEYRNRWENAGLPLKEVFSKGNYAEVFGLLQFIMRHPECPPSFGPAIQTVLERCRAAYRVIDDDTIAPISLEEEGRNLDRAFADLDTTEFDGARTHLKAAASELTNGNPSDSVRESIQAVESVARVIGKSKGLGPALAALEKTGRINPQLRDAFVKLYAYTNSEEGIRHPLLESGKPNVDETDALYMLGACSAFVSYLIQRARVAGLAAAD